MTRGFSCCRTLEGWLTHSYILLSGGIWRQVWCSALPIIIPFSAVCTVAAFGAQQNESWAQGNAWSLEDVLQQLQHPLLRPGCGTAANVVMCWNAVAPPAWIQAKQCTESKTCHGWCASLVIISKISQAAIWFFFFLSNSMFERMQRVGGKHRSVPKEPAPSIHPTPRPPPHVTEPDACGFELPKGLKLGALDSWQWLRGVLDHLTHLEFCFSLLEWCGDRKLFLGLMAGESKIQSIKQWELQGLLSSWTIFAKRTVKMNFLGSYMHII